MSNRRDTIVISGVPGVGKTTVSRLLAEFTGYPAFHVSELARSEGITTGSDDPRETAVIDIDKMRERLTAIIEKAEGPVIVEGHFVQDVVPPERVSHAFILRRAPWELMEELSARGYPEGKVWENVEAELVDVCLVEAVEALGGENVCEMDATGKDPAEVAERMASIVRGMAPCDGERVDWLGREETRTMLEGRNVRRD